MAFKVSIPQDSLLKVAKEEGCDVDVKASYILIKRNKSKNCLFVAKTKEVSRVDIGGFDVNGSEFIRNLGGESHGCVHQQIRSDITREQFILTFRTICAGLDGFESHPKKERPRPHAFRGGKKKPLETVIEIKAEETPAQTVERLVKKLALIRSQSASMGIPVSPKTEKELNEQIHEAAKKAAITRMANEAYAAVAASTEV
jgi:hypothetical protein